VSFRLRLDAAQAPGAVAQEEEATVEHIGPRVVVVRLGRLQVSKGVTVTLEETGGSFRCSAEVSSITFGPSGQPKVSLRVLGAAVPDRLLTVT
jgi:hypothetical protein